MHASIERRLSVTNLSSENNFADVSTECSSRFQGESERSVKQRSHALPRIHVIGGQRLVSASTEMEDWKSLVAGPL